MPTSTPRRVATGRCRGWRHQQRVQHADQDRTPVGSGSGRYGIIVSPMSKPAVALRDSAKPLRDPARLQIVDRCCETRTRREQADGRTARRPGRAWPRACCSSQRLMRDFDAGVRADGARRSAAVGSARRELRRRPSAGRPASAGALVLSSQSLSGSARRIAGRPCVQRAFSAARQGRGSVVFADVAPRTIWP